MKTQLFFVLAGVLALAACETPTKSEPSTDPTLAVMSGDACPTPAGGGYLYTFEPPSLEVGDSYLLTPCFSSHPGAMERLPGGCVGNLSASPAEAIIWSRQDDGTALATVSDAAIPGKPIRLTSDYAGSESISLIISVYEASENPLIGFWTQKPDDNCEEGSRIRELIFSADGTFSVTWTPFERYKDYWGDYTYDPETGVLTLTPERGNHIPEDVSSGPVSVENNTLVLLDGMSFGSNYQGQACAAPFTSGRG